MYSIEEVFKNGPQDIQERMDEKVSIEEILQERIGA